LCSTWIRVSPTFGEQENSSGTAITPYLLSSAGASTRLHRASVLREGRKSAIFTPVWESSWGIPG
jgi:hypothetical protein